MGEDLPAVRGSRRIDPLGVDSHHDALVAELLGGFADEFAAADGSRIDRHLVRARCQQHPNVLDHPHAAADGQRHEAGLRGAADHIEHGAAVLMGGGDVEEGELVGAGGIIGDRRLHRIAGIAQVDEVDALDDPAVLHIQAGDDANLEHGQAALRAARISAIASAGSSRPS